MTTRGEFELRRCAAERTSDGQQSNYLEVRSVRPAVLGLQSMRLIGNYGPDFGTHDILIEGYHVGDLDSGKCDAYWREVLLALCAAPRVIKQRFTIKLDRPSAEPFEVDTRNRTYRILIAACGSSTTSEEKFGIVARALNGSAASRENHSLSPFFDTQKAAEVAWQNGFEVTPAVLPSPVKKLIDHLLDVGLAVEVERDVHP